VGVERYEEGSMRLWCGFNDLVSARERRQWKKVLLEDETKAAISSWLNGKEA
jgi:hypothetical protein